MTISKYIRSMGLEVECGYDCENRSQIDNFIQKNNLSKKFDETTDGSVHVHDVDRGDREFRFWSNKKEDIMNLGKVLFYVAEVKTNSSCGMHIHIRTNKKYTGLFTYEKFFNDFIKAYKEEFTGKTKYIARLKNSYCRSTYNFSNVISQLNYGGDRYTAINYQSLPKHKTIEFRILPAVSSYEEYKYVVSWFIKTVDGLLKKYITQKRPVYAVEDNTLADDAPALETNFEVEIQKLVKEVI